MLATLDGKTIILGVLDLNDMTVESPGTVMDRVRRALPYAPPVHDQLLHLNTFRFRLPAGGEPQLAPVSVREKCVRGRSSRSPSRKVSTISL